jgi:hypothetical protein
MLDSFTGIFIVVGNLPHIASTLKTEKRYCNETCDLQMEVDDPMDPQPKKAKKRKAMHSWAENHIGSE